MALTKTDITNIYKVFIAILSQVISAMMNGLVLPLRDSPMPLSIHTELCRMEVKTFAPHDILSIQY